MESQLSFIKHNLEVIFGALSYESWNTNIYGNNTTTLDSS